MPGVDLRAVVGAVGLAAGGWGDPGEGLSQGDAESLRGDIGALQQEESDKLKKIKRGKTKTLDLAMRRRGSGMALTARLTRQLLALVHCWSEARAVDVNSLQCGIFG